MSDWPDSLPITPIVSPFDVTIDDLPGSKSITNRALLLAAMAEGRSTLTNVLLSEDSRVMMDCLGALGVAIDVDEADRCVKVTGCGGRWPEREATLFVGNSGTTIRFLTAACAACAAESPDHAPHQSRCGEMVDGASGESHLGGSRFGGSHPGGSHPGGSQRGHWVSWTLDGIARMRERPIQPLADALVGAGAAVDYLEHKGYPPIRVRQGVKRHPTIRLDPSVSSQYVSALLMAGPAMGGATLQFTGALVSKPYVQMTLSMLQQRGVQCQVDPAWRRVTVPGSELGALSHAIEPDASNASYFLAAAAVRPGARCRINGIGKRSLQGDARFAQRVLAPMGCQVAMADDSITVVRPASGDALQAIDMDLNDMPDMAQTLAVVALFAQGTTIIRNVGNLRVKETDRLEALRVELSKLGAAVTIEGDDLHIVAPAGGRLRPATIATYDDHRMAMAFAIAGLASPGVVIDQPRCVAKTFPRYFEYLGRLMPGDGR